MYTTEQAMESKRPKQVTQRERPLSIPLTAEPGAEQFRSLRIIKKVDIQSMSGQRI